jgi:GT2 family glycosyltransferase
MNPKVAIIILNWNGWKDTIECLESVFRIDYPNYQVIVIDNGSTDDSIERIKAWAEGKQKVLTPESTHPLYNLSHPPVSKPIPYIEYDRESAETGGLPEKEKLLYDSLPGNIPHPLILIQSGSNLGFSGGNNVGIRYALRKDFNYIMLLNNDMVLNPNGLKDVIDFCERDENIGIIGGKIFYYDYPEIIWNACGKFQFLWKIKYYGLNSQDKEEFNHTRKVTFISGALMLVKKSVFEKIGLLPEAYFFGVEDLEFCKRTIRNGFKMYYAPPLTAWHKVGGSRKKISFDQLYSGYLSYFLFVKRNYPYIIYKILTILVNIILRLNLIRDKDILSPKDNFKITRADRKLAIKLALEVLKVKNTISFSDLENVRTTKIERGKNDTRR